MPESITHRSLTPEIKIISEKEGIVEYIASDQTIDSHREIVSVNGWRFTRFEKNAPFVNSHNYWSIEDLLGKVISFEVKGGKLIERVQWAIDVPSQPLAKLGFDLTKGGYLKAVSVGFMPVRWACPGDEDFVKAVKDMKLTAEQVAGLRCIWLEQEQFELSACIIGSNPNALAKAFNDGAVTEEAMVKLGFTGEEELRFLNAAAASYETADPVLRGVIDNELARIRRAAPSLSQGNKTPAPPHSKPDGAEEAKRLADEGLRDIAKRLEALTKRPAPKA